MKNKITVNLKGYAANQQKLARITVKGSVFSLVDAKTGFPIYTAPLPEPLYDADSDDYISIADFTDFTSEGRYFIKVGFRRSHTFEISASPYSSIRTDALNAIFLNRCGYDFLRGASENDRFFYHSACHVMPAVCKGEWATTQVFCTGGWHTRLNYSKKTRDTVIIIAQLIYACRLFPGSFSVPETEAVFSELRWGLEYLMKLQDRDDGGVYEEIGHGDLSPEIMSPPEDDADIQYTGWKTTSATLNFTAVCAAASQLFRYDRVFSRRLAVCAERAWLYVCSSDEYKLYHSRSAAASEDVSVQRKESDFMWALYEMYSLTGQEDLALQIQHKYLVSQYTGFGMHSVGCFAALSYLLTDRRTEGYISTYIRRRIVDYADRIGIECSGNGYGAPFSEKENYRAAACKAVECAETAACAFLISNDERHLTTVNDCLSWIMGTNACGRAFVTGGSKGFVHNPSHRLSMTKGGDECVNGMIVAGPDCEPTDQLSKWTFKPGTPPALCYVDNPYSYSTNRPSLPATAALVFLSAFFDKYGRNPLYN